MNKIQNVKPLDDLEMFELIQLCYPEKFPDESDETWDAVRDFVDCDLQGEEMLSDLLARVCMLALPVRSPLSGTNYHCLGQISENGEGYNILAAVKREAVTRE